MISVQSQPASSPPSPSSPTRVYTSLLSADCSCQGAFEAVEAKLLRKLPAGAVVGGEEEHTTTTTTTTDKRSDGDADNAAAWAPKSVDPKLCEELVGILYDVVDPPAPSFTLEEPRRSCPRCCHVRSVLSEIWRGKDQGEQKATASFEKKTRSTHHHILWVLLRYFAQQKWKVQVEAAALAVEASVLPLDIFFCFAPLSLVVFESLRQQHEKEPRTRLVVGISGAAGAGKSVFTQVFQQCLQVVADSLSAAPSSTAAPPLTPVVKDPVAVGIDGYHMTNEELEQHGQRLYKGRPHTFHTHALAQDLAAAKKRDPDLQHFPAYNRTLHNPVSDGILVSEACTVVLLEGILLFTPPFEEVADQIDVAIYLDIPESVTEVRVNDRKIKGGKSHRDVEAHYKRVDMPNHTEMQGSKHQATWHVLMLPRPSKTAEAEAGSPEGEGEPQQQAPNSTSATTTGPASCGALCTAMGIRECRCNCAGRDVGKEEGDVKKKKDEEEKTEEYRKEATNEGEGVSIQSNEPVPYLARESDQAAYNGDWSNGALMPSDVMLLTTTW